MNRPDRDKYVNIEWKNIKGGKNNKEYKKQENEWVPYTPYDWKSVMHYPAINSNSKKDGNGKSLNTMTSKVHILIIDFIDPEKYRLIESNRVAKELSLPERIYNPIMAMWVSAMFIFQLHCN